MSDDIKPISVLTAKDFENAAQIGAALSESTAQNKLLTAVDGHGTRDGNVTAATTDKPTAVTRDEAANRAKIDAFRNRNRNDVPGR